MEKKLLNVKEVSLMIGFSTRDVWRRVSAGSFPLPVQAGSRAKRWHLSEVEEWISNLPKSKN